MPWILLGGLSFALGYAVFQSGGVLTGDWDWCLLAIGVVALLHIATSWREPAPPLDRISRGLLVAMVLLSLLQVVPLPVAVVRWLSPARMEIAAAAFPVHGSVSWLTLSAVPDATWAELRSVLAFGLVCVVVRDLCARFDDRPWIVASPLIVIAFLEAVLGLVQASLSGDEVARGTYVNRDHFAGFLEMVLPFAVLGAVAILRRNHQRFESPAGPALKACGLLVVAACVFIAILLSLSRMGFLAALASLFVMGTMSVGVARVGWKRWAPGLAVLVLVAAAIVYLPTDALIARFANLASTDQISSDTRAQIWQDSIGLVKAFPVAGCGFGAYESCFYRYKTVAPMFTVDYAHNDYLQCLAEQGVVALAVMLLFFGRILFALLNRGLAVREVSGRCLAIACIGSFAAIFLHSFVDFNLHIEANAFLLAWVAGIASTFLPAESWRASLRERVVASSAT